MPYYLSFGFVLPVFLQTRLRELYQQSKQNAQQRRANEFGIVKTKYDEGVAYIDAMPVED